jgi:hydrogenase expression/formation protein HypC
MCIAIPGKIVKISGRKAWVKYPTVSNEAMIGDETVKVGDWVMVQMGIVMKKVSKKEAEEMMKGWEKN